MSDSCDFRNGDDNTSNRVRILSAILLGITLVGAFWAGFSPIRSCHDTWWHLKTGEYLWNYFLANGFHFPPFDVFTYTGDKTPWVNHEWLGELVFYWAYMAGGLQSVVLLKSMVLVLTFGLLIVYLRLKDVNPLLASLGGLTALLASQFHLFLRPFIFTYLFIVVFLLLIHFLQKEEHKKKAFVLVVFGEILWINLHGGGLLGVILIGIWWASDLWNCFFVWLKGSGKIQDLNQVLFSSMVLLFVALASFANPWGYEIHLLPGKVTNDAFLTGNIGELAPSDFRYAKLFELIILGLLFLLAFRVKTITVFDSMTVIFFAHQALNHMRHMPLFAIAAVPVLIKGIDEFRKNYFLAGGADQNRSGFLNRIRFYAICGFRLNLDVLLLFLFVAYSFGWNGIWQINLSAYRHLVVDGYIKKEYPDKACTFILYNKIPGRMFNHDNFSGYLIWRLSPEFTKIWTDTRYDLWGSQYMKEELGVLRYMDIPLGFNTKSGGWMSITDYRRAVWSDKVNVFNRDDVTYIMKNDPSFTGEMADSDFMNWYKSEKPYWKYVLDKYNVNYIITYGVEPVSRYLKKNYEDWILIFEGPPDEWYTIFLRNTPENQELIQKYGLNHKEHYLKPASAQ